MRQWRDNGDNAFMQSTDPVEPLAHSRLDVPIAHPCGTVLELSWTLSATLGAVIRDQVNIEAV